MDLILTVAKIVAPVFLLASIGFVWVKVGFDYQIQFVTRMAMSLAVPALVFTALMNTEVSLAAMSIVSLAAIVGYGAVTLAAFLFLRLTGMEIRTYLVPLVFGNTANMGLPLSYFAFGNEGLGYGVVIFAIMAVYMFTFGVWLVSGAGSALAALKEPLVWATLLGALFLWQGWTTPAFLTNTLELVAQLAIPLMLITLGVAVARLKITGLGCAIWLSLLKAVGCVGLAWIIGRWFQLSPVAFGVLVLQFATPVAVTAYLLAEKYGADSDRVAGLVVVSALLSIATVPLTLLLLL